MTDGMYTDIASIIAGFGTAMLFFRIQRELDIGKRNEVNWIPWSDRLLIGATLVSLLLVIFPVVAFNNLPGVLANLPAAGCSATSIMVSGYILGILAHYRLIFGRNRSGERENPEPAEKIMVILTAFLAVSVYIFVLFDLF